MSEKRSNLEWETEQNLEQEKLYAELEKDVESWFEKGIVSESEYRQAKTNYENAKVKLALTKIDRIIYNNDLSMLFVSDFLEGQMEGENEN
jgi:outer membrane protein TolC